MKYTVTSPVEHDGKRYGEGVTIDLAEDIAQPLLKVGAIAAPAARARKADPAPEGDKPADKPAEKPAE